MTKIEKMAKTEFKKLSKKQQKILNNLQRIPVSKTGHSFDDEPKPRQKRWDIPTDNE